MFGLLLGISVVITVMELIKEANTKPISADYWGNKELYYEDINNGVPMKEVIKNLENGKYKLKEEYPEPHRDKDEKVIVEKRNL